MSQSIDDLKQQQLLDETRTAALNAQTARLQAEKALAKAQQGDSDAKTSDADVADAKRAADIAGYRKSETETARSLLKEAFEVPVSGYAGEVKTGSKAGGVESSLLAARALTTGAQRIAEKLRPVLDSATPDKTAAAPVVICGYDQIPAFQMFVAYKTQYTIVQTAIESALQGLRAAVRPAPSETYKLFTPQMAGLALDSVNKLLGFFRTDYSVEGVDVKFDDNVALVNALAGELAEKHKYDVRIPGVYGQPVDLTADPIFAEITALANQDIALRQAVAAGEKQLAGALAAVGGPNLPADEKSQSEQTTSNLRDALEIAKAAQALYDTFSAKLAAGDDKNPFPLNTILQQNTVRNLLRQGSRLLAVRIEKAGGTYYTRKNLWSFFGGMPFFNMGGVVITYALFEGDTGRILASGTLPVDGGFVRISKLSQELAK